MYVAYVSTMSTIRSVNLLLCLAMLLLYVARIFWESYFTHPAVRSLCNS